MAEPWQLLPRKAGAEATAPVVQDLDRPQIPFSATFLDSEAKPEMPNSYDRRQVRRPGIESGKAILMLSPAAQVSMAGVAIRPQDLMIRLADAKVWRVGSTFKMAGGTIRLHINLSG